MQDLQEVEHNVDSCFVLRDLLTRKNVNASTAMAVNVNN